MKRKTKSKRKEDAEFLALVEKLTLVSNSDEAQKYVTRVLKMQKELKRLYFSNDNHEVQIEAQMKKMKELANVDKERTSDFCTEARKLYSGKIHGEENRWNVLAHIKDLSAHLQQPIFPSFSHRESNMDKDNAMFFRLVAKEMCVPFEAKMRSLVTTFNDATDLNDLFDAEDEVMRHCEKMKFKIPKYYDLPHNSEGFMSSNKSDSKSYMASLRVAPIKSLSRLMEKMKTKYADNESPARSITDYCRCTISFRDPLCVFIFYHYLNKNMDIVRVKNKLMMEDAKSKFNTNIHLNVCFKHPEVDTKMIIEIQLTFFDFDQIKRFEHKTYEILRAKDPLPLLEPLYRSTQVSLYLSYLHLCLMLIHSLRSFARLKCMKECIAV